MITAVRDTNRPAPPIKRERSEEQHSRSHVVGMPLGPERVRGTRPARGRRPAVSGYGVNLIVITSPSATM